MAEPTGLYAVYADAATWHDLRLDDRRPESPLYVGTAERSLQARDIKTHFFTGRTCSCTVRRSFAALLRDRLDLRGVPRNKQRPERPANFGLEPAADQRLTQWMHERLRLAYWMKPITEIPLDDIETGVIRTLRPH